MFDRPEIRIRAAVSSGPEYHLVPASAQHVRPVEERPGISRYNSIKRLG